MKKILITNDDGIQAGGLFRLAEAAARFGEVWVVAPDGQRSCAAHAITLHDSLDVYPAGWDKPGIHAFRCSGQPGDCVRLGCLNIMPEKPDVVLAGINEGHNLASDIQYSATVAAALEGAFQGILSIALSEGAGPCRDVTDTFLPAVLEELMETRLGYGQVWNVNFPDCAPGECRGILRGRRMSRAVPYRDTYHEMSRLPRGGVRYMVHGEYSEGAEEGSDFRAVIDRWISIGIVENLR